MTFFVFHALLAVGLAFVWAWGLTEVLLWLYDIKEKGKP